MDVSISTHTFPLERSFDSLRFPGLLFLLILFALSGTGCSGEDGGDGVASAAELEAILSLESDDTRFAALLELEQSAPSSPAAKIYLAHHYYLRGEEAAAAVYLESLKRRLESRGKEQAGMLAGTPAEILLSFHTARRAYERGLYGESATLFTEKFFPQLDGYNLSAKGSISSQWPAQELPLLEGRATEMAAVSLLQEERRREALDLYERLWHRSGTAMEEERFIAYLSLLGGEIEMVEEAAGGGSTASAKRLREELRSRLLAWEGVRPFDPSHMEIYVRLYGKAGLPILPALLELERLEYYRPAMDSAEYEGHAKELLLRTSSRNSEARGGESGRAEGSRVLEGLIRLWTSGGGTDRGKGQELLSKLPEELSEHRFIRYIETVWALGEGGEAALRAYMELEPLYSTFQHYYLRLWEAALAMDPPRRETAIGALRAGIAAAPRTATARRARSLLWRLDGPQAESGAKSSRGVKGEAYPLLEGELAMIEEFVRMGASPRLAEPLLLLLQYPDNLYTLQAELSLRRMREVPGFRSFLQERRETAEGRLRERLSSILGRSGS